MYYIITLSYNYSKIIPIYNNHMPSLYDLLFGPDSMPTDTIDTIDIYCVKTDHIVYFTDVARGQLQMLNFALDKTTEYIQILSQAIYDSKTITIYHDDLIIYCIVVDNYAYPSVHASPTS